MSPGAFRPPFFSFFFFPHFSLIGRAIWVQEDLRWPRFRNFFGSRAKSIPAILSYSFLLPRPDDQASRYFRVVLPIEFVPPSRRHWEELVFPQPFSSSGVDCVGFITQLGSKEKCRTSALPPLASPPLLDQSGVTNLHVKDKIVKRVPSP